MLGVSCIQRMWQFWLEQHQHFCALLLRQSWINCEKILFNFEIYQNLKKFLNRKIDDAIGATPIHLVGGIWGLISVGLFADPVDGHRGLFYGKTKIMMHLMLFTIYS